MAVAVVASLGMASASPAAVTKTNFKTMRGVCGMLTPDATVPTTYVLQNDIGPCNSDGLRVKGNDITVDLNGHTIKGMPLIPDGPDAGTVPDGGFGEGVGIRMVGNSRVTVTNSKYPSVPSTISDFDAGLVIQGGTGTSIQPATGNVVKNIQFVGNVGSQPFQGSGGCDVNDPNAICDISDFNDGLALVHADSNTIGPNNLFKANGSGGMRIDDHANNNTITGNTAEGNGIGFRILTGATGNLVTGNTSTGNFSGVAISFTSPNNTIRDNTVTANKGFGVVSGAMSDGTIIDHNTVARNRAIGIFTAASNSTVSANTVTDNGLGASGTGRGSGIYVGFGTDIRPHVGVVVSGNTVAGSGGNGIIVDCTLDQDPVSLQGYACMPFDMHDQILNNRATGNGVNGPLGTKFFANFGFLRVTGFYDLLDVTNTDASPPPFDTASTPSTDNPQVAYSGPPLTDCGNNMWHGNTATMPSTAFPACTLTP